MRRCRFLVCVLACLVPRPVAADDRDAFAAKSLPPNVMWLIDSSSTMRHLTCSGTSSPCFSTGDQTLVTETSTAGTPVTYCRSNAIDALGYNPATTYPYPDPDFTSGANELYPTGKAYELNTWVESGPNFTQTCAAFDCAQKARCIQSLTTFGYFFEPSGCPGSGDPSGSCGDPGAVIATTTPLLSGNLLRFYPPKYVAMRAVFKSVLTDAGVASALARQRMGLMTFNSSNQGGTLLRKMNPPCNQLCYDSVCTSEFANNRAQLKNRVDNIAFNTEAPLGEALDDIGCYLSDGAWPGGCVGDFSGGGDNTAPICLACQANFAIILSDGMPSHDTTADLSLATGAGDPQGYILPNVARFLSQNDLNPNLAGAQSVITYAVGFGAADPSNPGLCLGVLERAAVAGKGRCIGARDAAQLREALFSIINEIDSRTRAFTAPAIQTTRAQGENNANIAAMKPYGPGPLWEGHIFSFRLFDEFLEGTQLASGSSTDTGEIFILDADNQPVRFDNEGDLVSRPLWDAALCLAGDFEGVRPAITPTDPHNLAVTSCARVADETAANGRRIFTKLDPASGGTPDGFTWANVASIRTAMGLVNLEATKKVIGFFRGFDMLDILGQGNVSSGTASVDGRTYPRPVDRNLSSFGSRRGWWKLGDIYHSNPQLVVAPQEFIQAVPSTKSSYDQFFEDRRSRRRLLLAGANDGMLHAFDAGTPTGTTAPIVYTPGTGAEVWAFVPPHHLPRMATQLSCPNDPNNPCTVANPFQYYVDGSPQVRDAYVGTGAARATFVGNTIPSLAAAANADKWKSLVVVGDRDGGNRFTALDITDPDNPRYLWQFPLPANIGTGATQRAEAAGLSWSDVFPGPAPIVPVRFDADGSAATVDDIYLRWVVLLNGGFSRNQTAGRGVYMVDANDGTLLWKFERDAAGDAEHQAMRYSFAAPLAGVAWPSNQSAITQAFAVDTGGQVWKFDFSAPGLLNGGLAQWTGERIFEATSGYPALPDSDTTLSLNEYPYRPMFHMISAAMSRDTRELWVYVGSGDRDLLGNPSLAHTSGVTLASTIPEVVCGRSPYDTPTHVNRLYGLVVSRGRRVTSTPNSEADLTALNDAANGQVLRLHNPSDTSKYGWYLQLRPAEKVNNPSDVFNKVVYFTTYTPTGACAANNPSAVDSCDAPSGLGRLYALDFETGRPALDVNPDSGTIFSAIAGVTTSSADTSKELGVGIPAASAVTVGVANGRQSAALLYTSSNNPTPQSQRAQGPTSLVKRVMSTIIPKKLHDQLTKFGSKH